jgi:hypothetical protein
LKRLEERVLACETENLRLRQRIGRQNGAWLIALLLSMGGAAFAGASIKDAVFDTVKAKEIVVVDAKGTVRARMGGDLPDAVMANGRVSKRGTKAAGFIIYDEEGIERGGYATLDEGSNAIITLDTKYRMAAMMVAGPDQDPASAVQLIGSKGIIEMRADANGTRLSTADKTGLTFQQPEIKALSADSCKDQRELALKYPGGRICQARFTEAACTACIGGK